MKDTLNYLLKIVFFGSFITIILIGLAQCDDQSRTKEVSQEPLELSKDSENYYLKVTEYTYEGCEYIKVGYGKSIWGSHKGNCDNPIHKGQHPSPYTFDISK